MTNAPSPPASPRLSEDRAEALSAGWAALRRLRSKVRAALFIEAACRLSTAVVLIVCGYAILDWLVLFPDWLRTAFLLAGASALGICIYRKLLRPLFSPIPLDQLALAATGLPASMRDLLASSVAYAARGGTGSDALWAEILSQSRQAEEFMRRGHFVRLRPVARAVFFALLGYGAAGILGWFASVPYVLTAMDRVARPLSGAKWPRAQTIQPLGSGAIVARGEPYTVEMRLVGGDSPRQRAYVSWKSIDGVWESALMRRDDDGVYRLTLENIRRPIIYYFRSGDDNTSDRPILLRVADRPLVTGIWALVTPPRYAECLDPVPDALEDFSVQALIGSHVRIMVGSSKRLSPTLGAEAVLLQEDDSPLPLTATDDSAMELAVEIKVTETAAFQVRLKDGEGLQSPAGPTYRIIAQVDDPPTVSQLAPPGSIEATPHAVISLKAQVSDDVHIESATLLADAGGSGMAKRHDLLSGSRGAGCRSKELVHFAWPLESLGLSPGDVVQYVIEARDSFIDHDAPEARRAVRTRPSTITIVSPARFTERLWADLLPIHESLRRMASRLAVAGRGIETLDRGPAAGLALSESQLAELKRISAELRQLRSIGRASASALDEIARRAIENRVEDAPAAQRAERLRQELSTDVLSMMVEVARGAERAGATDNAAGQHEALRGAAAAEQELAEVLRRMLRDFEQWNQTEQFSARLRGILSRQEALIQKAAARAESAEPSKEPEERSSPAEAQLALRAEFAELVSSMSGAVRRAPDGYAASDGADPSQAIRDSLLIAEQSSITDHMDRAAGALEHDAGNVGAESSGLLESALQSQRSAAAGIRAMLAALEERPERRLAALSRELKDVSERLKRLIRAQAALIERHRRVREAAGGDDRFEEIGDRQESLERTTRQVHRMLKMEDQSVIRAARELYDAAEEMSTAAGLLMAARSEEAEAVQVASKDKLDAALAELNQFESRVDQALAEKSLEAIVELLRDIRRQQASLRTEATEISGRSAAGSGMSRAEGFRLARLGKAQETLIGPLETAREKIGESVVYQYACARLSDEMRRAAGRLRAADAAAAITAQDRILRDLGRLIDAAEAPLRRDEPKFVQDSSSSGGGGAGQGTPTQPVPPLAELMVLRAMQGDLLDATRNLETQIPAEKRESESHRREIEALGKAQTDVHDLARQLVEQAAKRQAPGPDASDTESPGERGGEFPAGSGYRWGAWNEGAGRADFGEPPTGAPDDSRTTASQPATRPSDAAAVDPELVRRLLGGEPTTLDTVERTLSDMKRAMELLVDEHDCTARTQDVQRDVVAGLDKLIDEAKKQLVAGRESGSYRRPREGRPSPQRDEDSGTTPRAGAGGGPSARAGTSEGGKGGGDENGDRDKLSRGWGYLPMRDREEIAQGFDEEYMTKYREQIARYYRVLAERGLEGNGARDEGSGGRRSDPDGNR